MRLHKSVFLVLALILNSCSKIEEQFKNAAKSSKIDLIVTPGGGGDLYKSEEDWKEGIKHHGSEEYRRLRYRAIRTAQDWKQYVIEMFPEAQETPPESAKPFPWALNERIVVLYSDFLHTGKPTAVLLETMPNLPTLRTLIVSEWDKGQWNELLRMDENGSRTPYLVYPQVPDMETGMEIRVRGFTIDMGPKVSFENNFFEFTASDAIYWDRKTNRYCFADTSGRDEITGDVLYDLCDQKDWENEQKKTPPEPLMRDLKKN